MMDRVTRYKCYKIHVRSQSQDALYKIFNNGTRIIHMMNEHTNNELHLSDRTLGGHELYAADWASWLTVILVTHPTPGGCYRLL